MFSSKSFDLLTSVSSTSECDSRWKIGFLPRVFWKPLWPDSSPQSCLSLSGRSWDYQYSSFFSELTWSRSSHRWPVEVENITTLLVLILRSYLNSETNIVVLMLKSSRFDGTSLEMIDSVGATDVNHDNTTTFVIVEISPWLRSVVMQLTQKSKADVEAEY